MKTNQHRILREILRSYLTLESECAQSEGRFGGDQWTISVETVTLNFLDLQGCLKNLSQRKREAVFYNVIMDMKQKDVAKIMGITTVSVGQYVEQACLQVARELGLNPEEE